MRVAPRLGTFDLVVAADSGVDSAFALGLVPDVVIAIVLAIEMKSLLIGESASPDDEQLILSTMKQHPAVVSVIYVRTEHLGPDEVLVAAKVEFDRDIDFVTLSAAIDAVEADVRRAYDKARYIFIEPDIAHGGSRR